MNKDKLNIFIKYKVMPIMLVITFFILLNYVMIFASHYVININYAIQLNSHVKDNNLSLPIPMIPLNYYNNVKVSPAYDFYTENFNQSVKNFHDNVIKKHYMYNELYDCKYWSYVWTLYWMMNEDKYNWNIKYLSTDNHVFVMVYNDSGYIIMDGKEMIQFYSE